MDEVKKMLADLKENMDERDVKMMAPLVLAYMGDAIYEVFVRSYLIKRGRMPVNELHRAATRYVKAKAQAEIVHALEELLTEEEWQVVKRGRNQKSATTPKNAALIDYKYATGFEALLGYLFFCGREQRLMEIMAKAVETVEHG